MTSASLLESPQAWEELKQRVVEAFDLDDPAALYAVSQWCDAAEKIRGAAATSKQVRSAFSSNEVLSAAIEYFRADVEENLAIFRAKLARINCDQKLADIRLKLAEAQGVFVDENAGERIVPELLSVLRIDPLARTKMLRQMVHAAMALAENGDEENITVPPWPIGLGDGIQEFADDLAVFLEQAGDPGRDLVRRVCRDISYAESIEDDSSLPRCIKFLAKIAAATGRGETLPTEKRRVGFASRGQRKTETSQK